MSRLGAINRHPTENVFYSAQNKQRLAAAITAQVGGGRPLQPHTLEPAMDRIFDAAPGLFQPQFFDRDSDFVDAVLRHVEQLNSEVIAEMVPKVRSQMNFLNHYAQYNWTTNQVELPPRASLGVREGETYARKIITLPGSSDWAQ